jgi:hypothetical protein
MVQAFLPSVAKGDKRIVLVDGVVAGAINRIPGEGEIRSNLAVGGTAAKTVLTQREAEICAALGPELKRRGYDRAAVVGSLAGGGTLAPGFSPGSITFSNNLTLAPNSTFSVVLNSNVLSEYSFIVTFGTVSVSNSVLSLTLGYTPLAGDQFTDIAVGGKGEEGTLVGVGADFGGEASIVATSNSTISILSESGHCVLLS